MSHLDVHLCLLQKDGHCKHSTFLSSVSHSVNSQFRGGAGNPKFVARSDRNVGRLGSHLWLVLGTLLLNLWGLMQTLYSVGIE